MSSTGSSPTGWPGMATPSSARTCTAGSGHGSPDDVRGDGPCPPAAAADDPGGRRPRRCRGEWLLAQPTSNGKTGIVGSCSGGRHAPAHRVADGRLERRDRLVGRAGVFAADEDLTPQRPVAVIDYTEGLSASAARPVRQR